MSIWQQYQQVQQEINAVLERTGRPQGSARLLAVSKTHPWEKIEELAAHGVRAFGENKVQELQTKVSACTVPDVQWHMIGHLQRNKVKQVLKMPVFMIHSVDSSRLAREIEKEAAKLGKKVRVLMEVNIGREESKSGVLPEEAQELARLMVEECPHLQLEGLMCVAPEKEEAEEVRPYFRAMRTLKEEIVSAIPGLTLPELSMGMSGDFRVALEEGATMIRVGSAIFGARQYAAKESG